MSKIFLIAILLTTSSCGYKQYKDTRDLEEENIFTAIKKLEEKGYSISYPISGELPSDCLKIEKVGLLSLREPDYSITLLTNKDTCEVKEVLIERRGLEV